MAASDGKNLYQVPAEYEIDGIVFPEAAFPKKVIETVKEMPLYKEDILLATYPKCGEMTSLFMHRLI